MLSLMENKIKKIALIANHLHQIRGRALETVTVRGALPLNSNNPAWNDEASDEDDTVVLAETCYTDSEGKSSDRVTATLNFQRRSATIFAFRRFTTISNVNFRTDSFLCRGS